MKKALLFAGLLLALTASVAMAAGVGVSWKNFCWGEEGSSTNLTWGCTTNSNVNIRMTCSFKIDADAPMFNGVGVFMEGMVEAPAVPDWWELSNDLASDCRYNLCTVSSDGSVLANAGADVCFDPWQGTGGGGLGLYSSDGNQMHVNAAWASAVEIPLLANTEYFAVQFRISGSKTVNSCTGCLIPAIWGLTKIDWTTPTTVNTLDVPYAPYPEGNQCLTWQSSTLPCGRPVPARNTTWGQVKSLYR
jgi:hypothetical protein